MSGKSACNDIASIRAKGKTDAAAMDALSNLNPITALGNAFGSRNQSDNAVVNLIRQNISSIQDTMVKNSCSNNSSLKQENIYRENPICFTSLVEACKNNKTGNTNMECLKEVRNILNDRTPINQENRNKTRAMCEINAAIQTIANQEATSQNVALLQSMQDAKGLMSSNKTDGLNCNEVNNDISNEQYLKVMLDCIQETSVNQSNIIDGCHPKVSSQLNNNDDMKKCLLESGILTSNTQSSAIKNDAQNISNQTSTGLDASASWASLIPIAIVVVVLIIGVIILYPQLSKDYKETKKPKL
jgi:hypothetical protein